MDFPAFAWGFFITRLFYLINDSQKSLDILLVFYVESENQHWEISRNNHM